MFIYIPGARLVVVAACYKFAADAMWILALSLNKAGHKRAIDLTATLIRPKIPKPLKFAISLQESTRITPFQEPTTAHDSNTIEVDDGTEAMRNGNDSAVGKLLAHDVPNELLGPLVDVAARLVD